MNIEKEKAKLEEYISIYEQLKCQIQPSEVKAIEAVLSELENSIPKKLIEDKIERYQKLNESRGYLTIEESYAKEELQKLLEKEGIKDEQSR